MHTIQLLVIDLFHGQPATDYALVKRAGILGVVFKASQGISMVDPLYESQSFEARAAGLLWGAYHFGDSSDPTQQADHFLAAADLKPGDLFALDFEDNGRRTMSVDQAEEFVDEVEFELGRPNACVLYSGDLIKENPGDKAFWRARRLWLAQYSHSPVVPEPWDDFFLWQYSGDGEGPVPHSVPGCPPDIDCNSYSGTPAELIAEWPGIS
jgi:lysozyme